MAYPIKGDLDVARQLSALGGKQANLFALNGEADFTTAEPAIVAGELYLNTVSGVGSTTAGQAFIAGRLYRAVAGNDWYEMAPAEGWLATSAAFSKRFDGTEWVFVGNSFDTWAAAFDYAEGDIAITPTGAVVKRSTTGTSTAQFDAAESADWTFLINGGLPAVTTWTADEYYYAGQLVIRGEVTLWRAFSGQSGATFNLAEAGVWVFESQSARSDWTAATVYVENQSVFVNGHHFRAAVAQLTTAQFDVAEAANWVLESVSSAVTVWGTLVYYPSGAKVSNPDRASVTLRATADHYSAADINTTLEMQNWEYDSQDDYVAYDASKAYVKGEMTTRVGSVYRKTLTELAAADTNLESNWAILSGDNQNNLHLTFSGTGAADVGVGQYFRSAGVKDNQRAVEFEDNDVTAVCEFETTAMSETFGALDSMQVRLRMRQPGNANQVMSIVLDDGVNSASELIEIGTGQAPVAVGGVDVGNVSSSSSVSLVDLGDDGEITIDVTFAFTGIVGTPVLRISPVVNLDGTAVADTSVTGAIVVSELDWGHPSEFVIEAEVLATVLDSSVAATLETLDAATGSGTIKYFTNGDVQSNTAALAVQVGDSLAGTMNGSFLFSNYEDGTQFIATDYAAGEWSIAVEGASTQVPLSRGRMELTLNSLAANTLGATTLGTITLSTAIATASVMPFTQVKYTQGGMEADASGWIDGNTASQLVGSGTVMAFTVPRNGKYQIQLASPECDAIESNDRPFPAIAVNGLIVEIFDNLNTATTGTDHNGEINSTVIDLVAGDIVQPSWVIEGGEGEGFGYSDFTSGSLPTGTGDVIASYFQIDELPTTQAILAGMVEPTPLHTCSLYATYNTFVGVDDPIAFNTTLDDTGSMRTSSSLITIQQGGKYRVSAAASLDLNEATVGDRFIHVVKNVADPVDDAAATAAAILTSHTYTGSTGVGIGSTAGDIIVDLIAGDTLIMYFQAAEGGDRVRTATFTVQQLPSSTVVNPDLVPISLINKVEGKVSGIDVLTPNVAYATQGDIISASSLGDIGSTHTVAIIHPAISLDAIVNIGVESAGVTTLDNDITPLVFIRVSTTQLDVFFEETSANAQNLILNISMREITPEYNIVPAGTVPVETLHSVSMGTAAGPGSSATIQRIAGYPNLDDPEWTYVYDPNGLIDLDVAGHSFKIKNAGRYHFVSGFSAIAGVNVELHVNGVGVTGTIVDTNQNSTITYIGDFLVGDTIQLNNPSSDIGRTTMSLVQLAAKTVTAVDSFLLEARDLDIASYNFVPDISTSIATDTNYDMTVLVPLSFTDTEGLLNSGGLTTKKSGRYKVTWICLNGASDSDYFIILVDGVEVSRTRDAASSSDREHNQVEWTGSLTEGQLVSFQRVGTGGTFIQSVEMMQLPSTEYVTPGDVPVETLALGRMVQTSAQAYAQNTDVEINLDTVVTSTNITANVGTNSLTVTQAGTYILNGAIRTDTGTNEATYKVKILVNGTVEVQSGETISVAGANIRPNPSVSTTRTLGIGDEITLVVTATGPTTARSTIAELDGSAIFLEATQISSRTVISATDTPVYGSFADDAAAAVGSVPVGGVYLNTTTGFAHTRMV